jgi:SPP1 family predicted phage head-tail adaptor
VILNLDAGLLRCELMLQQASLSPDGMGGFTESWTTVATIFGRLEPVSARSVFGADQRLETLTHHITIRQRDDVSSGMRFVLQDRIFEIITVRDPDETGRYLVCETREEGR